VTRQYSPQQLINRLTAMTYLSTIKQQLVDQPSLRWGSSFAFVVSVYASAVLVALNWPAGSNVNQAQPMAAMMIDLAPMPVAPETPPNAVAPGPVQEETPPPPPEPEPEPEIEPLPELPEIKEAEAVLPKELPPEPIEEEPEPIEEQVAQEDKAPPAFEAPPDDVAAAPMEGAVSLAPSQAKATWQSVLLGHL
jgi:periplasmic protein TonB